MEKIINVGGRLHNSVVGGALTGADEIKDDTKGKMQNVINQETDAELVRLDEAKQNNLTFDQTPTEESTNPVTSGGVYAADAALQQAIEAILLLIPSAASALNQLADKAFVNSSISTATATFRGTYNLVTDLELTVSATHQQIATALASVVSTADNNDYCFVQIPVSDQSTDIRVTERYKFDGTSWEYEYDLNNSGFTADQWAAINSGITSVLVGKLGGLPTAQELATMFAGKQNTLTFDSTPVAGSDNPVKSSGLYNAFAAINALIPSGADANNKLVAESRLVAYVTTLINALDATFDVTSADGHVTLRMTQADGVITSVQILTSDIASASALTTLGGRVSTAEADIDALQDAYAALTQSDVVIVNGALPSSGQQQNIIYRQPDQDHTPPQFYSDYMWNGTTWVLMATYNNSIDPRPKKGSQNLVTSGGVFDNMGALDVSELNATENPHTLATYADLSAALAAIPSDYQKGGMSIKFVLSNDNKYVQFRYMGTDVTTAATFTNTANWQGVDNEPTANSKNLVTSGGIIDYLSTFLSIEHHDVPSGWNNIELDNVMHKRRDYVFKNISTGTGTKNFTAFQLYKGDTLIQQISQEVTRGSSITITPTDEIDRLRVYATYGTASFLLYDAANVDDNINEIVSEAGIPNSISLASAGWNDVSYTMNANQFYALKNLGRSGIGNITFVQCKDANNNTVFEYNGTIAPGNSISICPTANVATVRIYTSLTSMEARIYDTQSYLAIALAKANALGNSKDIGISQYAATKAIGISESPFTNNVLSDGYECIKDARIITSDASIAKSVFSITYLQYGSENNLYIRIEKDGVNWNALNRSAYVKTNDIERFLVRVDDNTFYDIILDWTKIQSGMNLNSRHIIKPEKVILGDTPSVALHPANGQPFMLDAIKKADFDLTNEKDYQSLYWIQYVIRNGASLYIRVAKVYDGSSTTYGDATITIDSEPLKSIVINHLRLLIDTSKIPDSTSINANCVCLYNKKPITQTDSFDGYVNQDMTGNGYQLNSHVLFVNCNYSDSEVDGVTKFKTIKSALATIPVNNIHQNQYEVIIMPGVYNEIRISVPPYTHVHGSARDSVLVTNKGLTAPDGHGYLFDQGHDFSGTLTGGSSKLSNMTLESWDLYCIHYDSPRIRTLYNENLRLRKIYVENKPIAIIGGGGFGGGQYHYWKNCLFEFFDNGSGRIGEVGDHNKSQIYGNAHVVFDGCQFVNSWIRLGSIGGFGRYVCEIKNCIFDKRKVSFETFGANNKSQHANTQGFALPANTMEWEVIGSNNKYLSPMPKSYGEALMIEADNAVEGQVIYVSGDLANAIFGSVKQYAGGSRLKAKAVGYLNVSDNSDVTDNDNVKLWHRIGDCSSVSKSMTVIVGNTTSTVTLTEDYTTSKKSESAIIQQINAQLSGCSISKMDVDYAFSKFNVDDKEYTITNSDIEVFSLILKNGNPATVSSNIEDILGITLDDAAASNPVPVWTGYKIYTGLALGTYTVNEYGKLVSGSTNIKARTDAEGMTIISE